MVEFVIFCVVVWLLWDVLTGTAKQGSRLSTHSHYRPENFKKKEKGTGTKIQSKQ